MKSSSRFLGLFVALTLTTTTALSGQNRDPHARQVDSIFAEYDRVDSPGWAVLVVRNGEVLVRRGYGMANLEHQVPIMPSTVFDIASVSKQFTGMAISMLVERGEISLDDDVRQYIPDLPEFGHTITIRHLLHHTSGLRDWPGTLAVAGWRMDDVISFDQILTFAYNQEALNFEPGSEYSYSNTGYNMLAEVVARVSGRTFREWAEEQIFKPLGMHDTHFHGDHTEVVAHKAYGYSRDSDGAYHAVLNGLTALGSSSLYTTIDDLAKWVINFEEYSVGGETVVNRLFQRGFLNDGTQIGYAFGIGVGRYRGLRTYSHGGSWAAFRTFLIHFPEQDFSVVALGNFSPSNPNRTAYGLVDLYLADDLAQPPEEHAEESTDLTVQVPTSLLDQYVGTYRLGPAWYVTVTRSGNQLSAYATAEDTVPMTARSDSTFWVEDYGAAITFLHDEAGRVNRFAYRGMTCAKLDDEPSPSTRTLSDYTGEYVSDELNTSYVVAVEEDGLVMRHRRLGTVGLTRAWRDDFRGGAWFLRSVEFDRDETGRVTGLRITQSRSRNLQFEKRR